MKTPKFKNRKQAELYREFLKECPQRMNMDMLLEYAASMILSWTSTPLTPLEILESFRSDCEDTLPEVETAIAGIEAQEYRCPYHYRRLKQDVVQKSLDKHDVSFEESLGPVGKGRNRQIGGYVLGTKDNILCFMLDSGFTEKETLGMMDKEE